MLQKHISAELRSCKACQCAVAARKVRDPCCAVGSGFVVSDKRITHAGNQQANRCTRDHFCIDQHDGRILLWLFSSEERTALIIDAGVGSTRCVRSCRCRYDDCLDMFQFHCCAFRAVEHFTTAHAYDDITFIFSEKRSNSKRFFQCGFSAVEDVNIFSVFSFECFFNFRLNDIIYNVIYEESIFFA